MAVRPKALQARLGDGLAIGAYLSKRPSCRPWSKFSGSSHRAIRGLARIFAGRRGPDAAFVTAEPAAVFGRERSRPVKQPTLPGAVVLLDGLQLDVVHPAVAERASSRRRSRTRRRRSCCRSARNTWPEGPSSRSGRTGPCRCRRAPPRWSRHAWTGEMRRCARSPSRRRPGSPCAGRGTSRVSSAGTDERSVASPRRAAPGTGSGRSCGKKAMKRWASA